MTKPAIDERALEAAVDRYWKLKNGNREATTVMRTAITAYLAALTEADIIAAQKRGWTDGADYPELEAELAALPADKPDAVHDDYISHHNDWRTACAIARDAACEPENVSYWQHQIDTLDRIKAAPPPSIPPKTEADYFGGLVLRARAAAAKASAKFPQPNYVTLKIAEEAGEVVRGAVHYAEGRMPWDEVEGEIVQLLAMLIRFVTEGDQINGVTPPASLASPEGE